MLFEVSFYSCDDDRATIQTEKDSCVIFCNLSFTFKNMYSYTYVYSE